jgi:hypothetical protein
MSVSLKYISTENLIQLAEFIVAQDFDEGLDILIDEVLTVLLYRLPLVSYHEQVHAIETRRRVPA